MESAEEEEMADASYKPAILDIHVFDQDRDRTNLEVKLNMYNAGPIMWEIRRFAIVGLAPLPKFWRVHTWINKKYDEWKLEFELPGFSWDTHFKPSRKSAIALGGAVLHDAMVRQEYTINSHLLTFILLDLIGHSHKSNKKD